MAERNSVWARRSISAQRAESIRNRKAFFSAIVDALNRIRGPFNVSGSAVAAGVAALADGAHLKAAVEHNAKWLDCLDLQICELGLHVTPSAANVLLIHFPAEKGKTAADADNFLTGRGLILRRLENYGLPGALRLTVGSEEANRLVVDALRAFMGGAHG